MCPPVHRSLGSSTRALSLGILAAPASKYNSMTVAQPVIATPVVLHGTTEIVGVVNDVRQNGLAVEPCPTIFLAQSQVPGYLTNLVVRTAMDPVVMAATIRREVRQVDPRQPFTDIQPMSHYVSTQLARPRLYATFVGAFAALALFLATIGRHVTLLLPRCGKAADW